MGHIVLVTGGARSGKSGHAERLAAESGEQIAYIATAAALDGEMADRIARHRQQRPAHWRTYEAQLVPSAVIMAQGGRFDVLLLDCLTVLITNRLLALELDWEQPSTDRLHGAEEEVMGEVEAIIAAALAAAARVIIVTNEVGLGLVPLTPLARFFRDCAGRANQRLAAAAAEVHLVVAGIPMRIKGC